MFNLPKQSLRLIRMFTTTKASRMPEGPEVTTLTKTMRTRFPTNKYKITSMNLISGRYTSNQPPEGWDQLISKLPITLNTIQEKGKFIYFQLDHGISIWSTLGMSGGWTVKMNPRHQRLSMQLETDINTIDPGYAKLENIQLSYCDSRNFGTFKVCFDPNELNIRLNKLGASWLHEDVSYEIFRNLLIKTGKPQRNRRLAVFLMDQTKTSGIGNYILAEALYVAKIHPWAKVGALEEIDIEQLYHAIHTIIWESCNSQYDATSRRYVNSDARSKCIVIIVRVTF